MICACNHPQEYHPDKVCEVYGCGCLLFAARSRRISPEAENTLRQLYYNNRHIVPDAAHLYEIARACGVEIKI